MRALLLIASCAMSGCATIGEVHPREGAEDRAMLMQSGRTSRTTSGSRTQTVGLPLSRAGKIGLWAGVAVFLAYLMETDGEDDDAGAADP